MSGGIAERTRAIQTHNQPTQPPGQLATKRHTGCAVAHVVPVAVEAVAGER